MISGNSLVVQWLGLRGSTADLQGPWVWSLVRELRSCMQVARWFSGLRSKWYPKRSGHSVAIFTALRAVCVLSCAWLFATPWTVIARLLCPWKFPGKSTGVGSISYSRGSPWPWPWTWVWQVDSLPLRHMGSPIMGYMGCQFITWCLVLNFQTTEYLWKAAFQSRLGKVITY